MVWFKVPFVVVGNVGRSTVCSPIEGFIWGLLSSSEISNLKSGNHNSIINYHWKTSLILKTEVLYMSFDRFLLAVESRDLSQADKSIIRVSSFPN